MTRWSEIDPRLGHHVLIICVGFLLFSPCLFDFFISDDFVWISRGANLSLDSILVSAEGITHNTFRPLIPTMFFVLHRVFDLSPFGYHLCGILLHVLNGLLFYRIILHLPLRKEIALLSALIFVGHFAHEEIVFWISSICVLSCWFFSLVSIVGFLNWLRNGRLTAYLLCFGSASIALFLREDALILLPVFCGIAWLMSSPSNQKGTRRPGAKTRLRALTGLLPLAAMLFVYFYLRSISLTHLRLGDFFSANPTNFIKNFLYFTANLTLPVRLVFDAVGYRYSGIINSAVNSIDTSALIAVVCFLAVLAAIVVLFNWVRKRDASVRLSVVIFLIALLPSLFFRGYGLRFTYLPLLGFAPLAAHALSFLAKRISGRSIWSKRLGVSVAVIVVVLLNFFILLERHVWWKRASMICEKAVTGAGELLSSLPSESTVCFVDLPRRLHGAYIFTAGFVEAMDLFYPSYGNKIRTVDSESLDTLEADDLSDCHLYRFEDGEFHRMF